MDKIPTIVDRAVTLVQALSKIKEEGLPDSDIEEMTLVLNSLTQKAGVSASDNAKPLQKAQIIFSSPILNEDEKFLAGLAATCLSTHLKFQRNQEIQQLRDFHSGNNKITFLHPITGQEIGPFDKKTLDLIHRTRAMMLFPEQKNRANREKTIRTSGHNLQLATDEKTAALLLKRELRMDIVAVVFKIQCEHWFCAKKVRSLNVIMAANEKGYFKEWEKQGLHVGTAKKYMNDFSHVRHLLAANFALTMIDKKENPSADQAKAFVVPFISFLGAPARFFLVADRYREWAKDAGLIKSKKELWMPEGWKDLVRDAPPFDAFGFTSAYAEEIRRFDAFEKEYKDNKEWGIG